MIKGAPLQRRAFLDAAISQLKPAYLAALTDYAAVLKQRNALLKKEDEDTAELKLVARALLPEAITVGSRLKYEMLQYELV